MPAYWHMPMHLIQNLAERQLSDYTKYVRKKNKDCCRTQLLDNAKTMKCSTHNNNRTMHLRLYNMTSEARILLQESIEGSAKNRTANDMQYILVINAYVKEGKGEMMWSKRISKQEHRACRKCNDHKEQYIYSKNAKWHKHYGQEKYTPCIKLHHYTVITETAQKPYMWVVITK